MIGPTAEIEPLDIEALHELDEGSATLQRCRGLTCAGVQRPGALVDLLAELAELFHVRQQSPPDLFLVGIR